ncbi:MAG: methyltransferase domain-containing protein [Nitrospira sp. CR2.1]|nr:methyltransferase domain-containing protein [Nitrospira sp. CR2.1]
MSANQWQTWEEAVSWLVAQPDQQSLVKECYFDSPLEQAAERYWTSREWGAIRDLLPPHRGVAIDIGAGRGITSFALASDGWTVTALEPDPSSEVGAGAIRRLAASQCLPIAVIEDFGEHIPCPSESFDLVFARQALHHAKDLSAFCREAFRLLKPGGLFLTVRDHVISKQADLPLFLERHPLHRFYGGEHAYLLRDYVHALKSAGFTINRMLRPLESAINLAPLTEDSLQEALAARLAQYPGGAGAARMLFGTPILYAGILKLLIAFDSRPGRLYSFVCTKRGVV